MELYRRKACSLLVIVFAVYFGLALLGCSSAETEHPDFWIKLNAVEDTAAQIDNVKFTREQLQIVIDVIRSSGKTPCLSLDLSGMPETQREVQVKKLHALARLLGVNKTVYVH